MRCSKLPGRSMSMLGAIIAAGIFLTAHAAFADDGDEKCSKKGKLFVYDNSARMWENVGGECVPQGPNGPANGDRKCGVSGYTVKYVAKIDTWQNTQVHCSGGSSAGVHLENLHQGTEPSSPAGQNDVSAPSAH